MMHCKNTGTFQKRIRLKKKYASDTFIYFKDFKRKHKNIFPLRLSAVSPGSFQFPQALFLERHLQVSRTTSATDFRYASICLIGKMGAENTTAHEHWRPVSLDFKLFFKTVSTKYSMT